MGSVQAVFPYGIASWTDRIDEVDIVFALDPNTLAAEIAATETALGVTPATEQANPMGNPVVYDNVGARIHDVAMGGQIPCVELSQQSLLVANTGSGERCRYRPRFDPFTMFNGIDITVPCDGWWLVQSLITWTWWDVGYFHHRLHCNGFGNILHERHFDCGFEGNDPDGRWQLFEGRHRSLTTDTWWMGPAHKGDIFSTTAENGTTHANHLLEDLTFKAIMMRSLVNTPFVTG
jgi:hypothetical protein